MLLILIDLIDDVSYSSGLFVGGICTACSSIWSDGDTWVADELAQGRWHPSLSRVLAEGVRRWCALVALELFDRLVAARG